MSSFMQTSQVLPTTTNNVIPQIISSSLDQHSNCITQHQCLSPWLSFEAPDCITRKSCDRPFHNPLTSLADAAADDGPTGRSQGIQGTTSNRLSSSYAPLMCNGRGIVNNDEHLLYNNPVTTADTGLLSTAPPGPGPRSIAPSATVVLLPPSPITRKSMSSSSTAWVILILVLLLLAIVTAVLVIFSSYSGAGSKKR